MQYRCKATAPSWTCPWPDPQWRLAPCPFPRPLPLPSEIKLQFYDNATRARIPGQSTFCGGGVVGAVAPGVWRFKALHGFPAYTPVPGDLVTVSPRLNTTGFTIPDYYRCGVMVVACGEACGRGRRGGGEPVVQPRAHACMRTFAHMPAHPPQTPQSTRGEGGGRGGGGCISHPSPAPLSPLLLVMSAAVLFLSTHCCPCVCCTHAHTRGVALPGSGNALSILGSKNVRVAEFTILVRRLACPPLSSAAPPAGASCPQFCPGVVRLRDRLSPAPARRAWPTAGLGQLRGAGVGRGGRARVRGPHYCTVGNEPPEQQLRRLPQFFHRHGGPAAGQVRSRLPSQSPSCSPSLPLPPPTLPAHAYTPPLTLMFSTCPQLPGPPTSRAQCPRVHAVLGLNDFGG